MASTRTTAIAAGAVLLAVAGCAGTNAGTVYNSNFTAGYDRFSLGTAMSRAPLLVETYGTPAEGQNQEEISSATALALRKYGAPWLPRNYTDSHADAGDARYHLRVAYAVPWSFDRQRLCAQTMQPAAVEAARRADDADSTRTLAALCRNETMLGIAEGAPANQDVQSDSFARFVGLLGRETMPRHNPVLDDDCIFRMCD